MNIPITYPAADWKAERVLHLECALGHTWSESSYDDRRCPFCQCVALEPSHDGER